MKRASSTRLTLCPIPRTPFPVVAIAAPSDRRAGAHALAGRLDRLDDVLVAGAAAEVAADRPSDLLLRRRRVALQQRRPHQHHRRGAEAALEPVLLVERLL